MNKETIKKRFRNWKTWIAVFSLLGFLFTQVWRTRSEKLFR